MELDRILERLEELTNDFFALFGDAERRVAFQGRDSFREANLEAYSDLVATLDLLAAHLKLIDKPPDEIIPVAPARRWNLPWRSVS